MDNQSGRLKKCQSKQVANTLRNTGEERFHVSSIAFSYFLFLSSVCENAVIHIWGWGVSQLGGAMAGIFCSYFKVWPLFHLEA